MRLVLFLLLTCSGVAYLPSLHYKLPRSRSSRSFYFGVNSPPLPCSPSIRVDPGTPRCQLSLRVALPFRSRYPTNLFATKSKREEKFLHLMTELTSYSDSEINTIRSSRNRAIFKGAKAAAKNPEVVDAFVVLYEDLSPLRIAGNMIFNYLTSQISKSIERFDAENSAIVETMLKGGEFSRGTITLGKTAFEAIDKDSSGSITANELSDEVRGQDEDSSVNQLQLHRYVCISTT